MLVDREYFDTLGSVDSAAAGTKAASALDRLDSHALLHAATAAGLRVSARLLETLRAQRLIPRPTRSGYQGRTPMWTYPPGSDRQLIDVLRWREQTKDPDILRILIWLDGFSIPAADIRASLIRWAEKITGVLERTLRDYAGKTNLDPASPAARDQAVGQIAREAAAKRKPGVVPRHGRVTSADRERAMALMLRTFGLGQPVDGDREEQARNIEQVLGMSPGRRRRIDGQGPWLTGPASDLLDAADIVALPRLLETVRTATDADVEAARQTVIAIFRHLPLMVRFIDAAMGKDNYFGLAGVRIFDQQPEHVPYVLLVTIAMFRAGWTDNILSLTEALGAAPELAEGMQRILALPTQTLQANLDGKPAELRERIDRLINAATDGQLSPPQQRFT